MVTSQFQSQIKIYVPTASELKWVTDDNDILSRFFAANSGSNFVRFVDDPDVADIVVIFEAWSFKLPGYGKCLAKNEFFVTYAKKILVVNYDSTVGVGFLPGCYVSLKKSYLDFSKYRSVAYPKVYNELLNDHVDIKPSNRYLYWFRGTLHSHPVRKALFSVLGGTKNGLLVDNTRAFHTHSEAEKKAYLDELLNCHFVLCPRGTSPNSYRLYEAMQMGRCPVIISDEWVETIGPDWSKCSVRIAEKDIGKLEDILKERLTDSEQLGLSAHMEWTKHFNSTEKNKAYLAQLLDLYRSDASVTKSAVDYKKYWNSKDFLYANNWWYTQKIMRFLKRFIKVL